MRDFVRMHTSRTPVVILAILAFLLLAACQPIVDPALLEDGEPAAPAATATEESASLFEVEPAQATVNARSLRVRQGPSDMYDLVAGIEEGDKYAVLGMTSDGAWLQLEIEDTPDGFGWVNTEFVTLEGDITNIPTIPAEDSMAEEDAASEDAMAEEAEVEEAEPVASIGTATIDSPDLPLRVRSEPTTEIENKIGNVFHAEVYDVLAVSDDGLWLQINVPDLSDEGGWIAASFATVEGDAAELVVVDEVVDEEAEEVPSADDVADETDSEPMEEMAETEIDDAAETEATEEEATEDVVEEPVDDAEEDATEDVAEDATAETTDDAADSEADEADEFASAEPTTVVAGDRVIIETELPLRVRSAPTTEEDNKIGSVYNWDEVDVLEVSEDGLWLLIDVPELSEDGGWIAAEYATTIE